MRISARTGWVVAAALLGVPRCAVYDDALKAGLADASAGSGGSGGSRVPVPEDQWGSGIGWWSTKLPNGCISAGVPTTEDRPARGDDGAVAPLWFAISSMALGSLDRDQQRTDGAWKSLGFDLDGVCTNDGCGEPQDPPAVSCFSTGVAIPQDGHACRDNTFGRLEAEAVAVDAISRTYGLSNDGFNCALCNGDYNFLFRVTGWNGQPDDDSVRIDIYPSPGIEGELSWQCVANETTWHAERDAGRCWSLEHAFLFQEGTLAATEGADGRPDSLLYDPTAYVRQGYLVAQLPPNALFWFPGDRAAVRAFPLKLQGAVVAGKLVQDGEGWRLDDGTISGRALKSDLIEGFELLGFCSSDPNYGLMRKFVNDYADILAAGGVLPDAECDAVSVGIGFDARAARPAGASVSVRPLPGCAAGTGGTGGTGGTAGTGGLGGAAGSGGAAATGGASGADGGGATAGVSAGGAAGGGDAAAGAPAGGQGGDDAGNVPGDRDSGRLGSGGTRPFP